MFERKNVEVDTFCPEKLELFKEVHTCIHVHVCTCESDSSVVHGRVEGVVPVHS